MSEHDDELRLVIDSIALRLWDEWKGANDGYLSLDIEQGWDYFSSVVLDQLIPVIKEAGVLDLADEFEGRQQTMTAREIRSTVKQIEVVRPPGSYGYIKVSQSKSHGGRS